LNTGEVSGVPIIKGLMEKLPEKDTIVIDCPPGSSCIVMESIREANYCVLVAEPTLFGAHNLRMVYELVKLFNKPFGVVSTNVYLEKIPPKSFAGK
jgi:MinD superfamily P-loop ATPase